MKTIKRVFIIALCVILITGVSVSADCTHSWLGPCFTYDDTHHWEFQWCELCHAETTHIQEEHDFDTYCIMPHGEENLCCTTYDKCECRKTREITFTTHCNDTTYEYVDSQRHDKLIACILCDYVELLTSENHSDADYDYFCDECGCDLL